MQFEPIKKIALITLMLSLNSIAVFATQSEETPPEFTINEKPGTA